MTVPLGGKKKNANTTSNFALVLGTLPESFVLYSRSTVSSKISVVFDTSKKSSPPIRFYPTNSSSSNPCTLYRAVITHCKTTPSYNSKSRKHRIDRCSCSSNERQRTNWAFIYALIPFSRVAMAAGRT